MAIFGLLVLGFGGIIGAIVLALHKKTRLAILFASFGLLCFLGIVALVVCVMVHMGVI
jgi:hypothetical protein